MRGWRQGEPWGRGLEKNRWSKLYLGSPSLRRKRSADVGDRSVIKKNVLHKRKW